MPPQAHTHTHTAEGTGPGNDYSQPEQPAQQCCKLSAVSDPAWLHWHISSAKCIIRQFDLQPQAQAQAQAEPKPETKSKPMQNTRVPIAGM